MEEAKVSAMLKLTSRSGDEFIISRQSASLSGLLKETFEMDSDDEVEIPLPNVDTAILAKVIEFMNYHVEHPMPEIEKPLRSANMDEVMAETWYAEFAKALIPHQEKLFELILASNYMEVTPLLNLTTATVASMIKGKTPEEIRKTFNIVNDFTPEEEARVREENKWCEEV